MVLNTIIPVFLVILLGFFFGKANSVSKDVETFIHQFVINLALPALLFLAITQAHIDQLFHTTFLVTVLGGIFITYTIAIVWAKMQNIHLPDASIVAMGSSYGTTGFMGIPLLLVAFGDDIGVVAAIATILHNIPVILLVIASYEHHQTANSLKPTPLWQRIVKIIITNPLVLSVLLGSCFALTPLTLPDAMAQFCRFFGAAAGPLALFSLGLGLGNTNHIEQFSKQQFFQAIPIVIIKLFIHPLITFVIGYYLLDMQIDNPYFICAMMMSALPVGVATHVFSKLYGFYSNQIAIANVLSLIISFFTLSALITYF